jgi:hypothetical protein
MIVCPVCEHPQPEGAECEVCGKKLVSGPAAVPFVPPVEGLEPTLHAPVDAAGIALAELEPTRQRRVEARAEQAPDLDLGRAAPVDVADDPVPGLERTGDDAPQDAPTAVPAAPTCRYCRTPAKPGERVCGRCGMRLPIFGERAEQAEPLTRQCGCGLVVLTGGMCPNCGARLP